MAEYSYVMLGWSGTEVSVLGSQVFGQASVEGFENWLLYLIKICKISPKRTEAKRMIMQNGRTTVS